MSIMAFESGTTAGSIPLNAVPDEQYEDALIYILNNAESVEEARQFMQMLGYLPYTRKIKDRARNMVIAGGIADTNGYLTRRGSNGATDKD